MSTRIDRVAVIGAGTMGGGITALIASVGIPVVLLDIAPTELTSEEQARGLGLSSAAVRNRIVASLWERQLNAKPPALFTPEDARRVTLGNLEDDFEKLREVDWIVEAIVEQLEPKQQLMARIEAVRKPHAIVSSNTSGIPIHAIASGRSAAFRSHFLGTHFFNPPRYMHLLEVIPTADTDPHTIAFMRQWAEKILGKGTVLCNDRPNFIANRIGSFASQTRLLYALHHGYMVEEVDLLSGPLIGNPRTASFRLRDLVGLDVSAHVLRNLYDALSDDENRELFKLPPILERQLSERRLGNKTGAGFYRRATGPDGERRFDVLDLDSGEYRPAVQPCFALVEQVRAVADLGERMRAIFTRGAGDRAGDYIINTTLPIMAYAARRIPEISGSIQDVDNAMRWGFALQAGPFELWDMLGVRWAAELMRQKDIAVASWVDEMLNQGIEAFYQRDGRRAIGVYAPELRRYLPIERPANVIVLEERLGTAAEIECNEWASLLDLGDGALCLAFHGKGNALDLQVVDLGFAALGLLEGNAWRALVIAGIGKDFSTGANINRFVGAVPASQPAATGPARSRFQNWLMALRGAGKPVVAATFGRVLGGGAELAMHCARICAAAETYMGLVETRVGLIPGGGGCKELLRRVVAPQARDGADPMPYLRQIFETIALAKVSECAAHARALGFLSDQDVIVMNPDHLIGEAKRLALDLAAGYRAPDRDGTPIYALGERGKTMLGMAIRQLEREQHISEHDALIAGKLAHILAGGDLPAPAWVGEQCILDLEREAFAELLGEAKTQERIAYTLKTRKPLRN